MQNYQGVPELFKKTSRWEGVHLPPQKKKAVFMHFKFLFMHSWMLYAPHLVPDIEYFSRINHIIFNWEQKWK